MKENYVIAIPDIFKLICYEIINISDIISLSTTCKIIRSVYSKVFTNKMIIRSYPYDSYGNTYLRCIFILNTIVKIIEIKYKYATRREDFISTISSIDLFNSKGDSLWIVKGTKCEYSLDRIVYYQEYKNNEKNGWYKEYNNFGEVHLKIHYENGMRNGPTFIFSSKTSLGNGKVGKECNYKDDVMHGICREYDYYRDLVEIKQYKNGEVVSNYFKKINGKRNEEKSVNKSKRKRGRNK